MAGKFPFRLPSSVAFLGFYFFGLFWPEGNPKLKANFKRPLPPPSADSTLHTWRDGGDGLFAQVLLKKEPYLTHSVESNGFFPTIRFYVKLKTVFVN